MLGGQHAARTPVLSHLSSGGKQRRHEPHRRDFRGWHSDRICWQNLMSESMPGYSHLRQQTKATNAGETRSPSLGV